MVPLEKKRINESNIFAKKNSCHSQWISLLPPFIIRYRHSIDHIHFHPYIQQRKSNMTCSDKNYSINSKRICRMKAIYIYFNMYWVIKQNSWLMMCFNLLPVDSLLNSVCKWSLIINIESKENVCFFLTSSPLLLKWMRLSMMRGIIHVESKTNVIM